jgi:hypothetical protein
MVCPVLAGDFQKMMFAFGSTVTCMSSSGFKLGIWAMVHSNLVFMHSCTNYTYLCSALWTKVLYQVYIFYLSTPHLSVAENY